MDKPSGRAQLWRAPPINLILPIALAVMAISFAASVGSTIPSTRIDGYFQTASSVDRLFAGEFPVRDFDVYLGPLIPIALFPAAIAFGGSLAAIGTATQLLLVALFCLLLLFFSLLTAPSARLRNHLWFATALLSLVVLDSWLLAESWIFSPIVDPLSWWIEPGPSLRPLRAAGPVLAAAGGALLTRFNRGSAVPVFFGAVLGAWAGAGPNDYGFVSTISLGIMLVFARILQGPGKFFRRSVLVGALAWGFFFAGSLLLISGFQPGQLFSYSFGDILNSQFWFWEPSDAGSRVTGPDALLALLLTPKATLGIVGFTIGLVSWIRRQSTSAFFGAFLGLSLSLGGITASLGGYINPDYFSAAASWGFLQLLGLLSQGLRLVTYRKTFQLVSPIFTAVAIGSTVVLTGAAVSVSIGNLLAADRSKQLFVPELGGWVQKGELGTIELAKTLSDEGKVIFEDYWGLASAINSGVPRPRVDSIIHARGSREVELVNYLETVPDYVLTTAPTANSEQGLWTSWNLGSNWPFYRTLVTRFELISATDYQLVWKRAPSKPLLADQSQSLDCENSGGNGSKQLRYDRQRGGFYLITLKQEPLPTARALNLVQNNLNLVSEGFIALNPRKASIETVVFLPPGRGSLELRNVAGPEVKLLSCALFRLSPEVTAELEEAFASPVAEKDVQLVKTNYQQSEVNLRFPFSLSAAANLPTGRLETRCGAESAELSRVSDEGIEIELSFNEPLGPQDPPLIRECVSALLAK